MTYVPMGFEMAGIWWMLAQCLVAEKRMNPMLEIIKRGIENKTARTTILLYK